MSKFPEAIMAEWADKLANKMLCSCCPKQGSSVGFDVINHILVPG